MVAATLFYVSRAFPIRRVAPSLFAVSFLVPMGFIGTRNLALKGPRHCFMCRGLFESLRCCERQLIVLTKTPRHKNQCRGYPYSGVSGFWSPMDSTGVHGSDLTAGFCRPAGEGPERPALCATIGGHEFTRATRPPRPINLQPSPSGRGRSRQRPGEGSFPAATRGRSKPDSAGFILFGVCSFPN